MPNVFNPIVFDPTATVNDSLLSMQSNNVGGCAQFQTPIVFNGFLYWIGLRIDPTILTNHIQVWRSPLDGSAWTLIDGAASPTIDRASLTCGAFFDGANTITVAYITASPTIKSAILLRTFDLTTETWGALFAPGGPVVSFVDSLWVRSDATFVVLHSRVQLPGARGVAASVWNGAAWTTFAIDTNATNIPNTSASAVLDPATDVIHVFMRTAGQTATYQQFDITNTLGSFTNFSAADIGCTWWQYTNPIIMGNYVLFGPLDPTDSFPVLLYGTPLTAPVFTVSPTIDPTGGVPRSFTSLVFTGSAIVGIYILSDFTSMRLVYTTNLLSPGAGWIGEDLQGTTDPSNYNIQKQQVGLLTGDPYGALFAQFEQSLNYISNQPNVVGGVLDFAALTAAGAVINIDATSVPVVILPSTLTC